MAQQKRTHRRTPEDDDQATTRPVHETRRLLRSGLALNYRLWRLFREFVELRKESKRLQAVRELIETERAALDGQDPHRNYRVKLCSSHAKFVAAAAIACVSVLAAIFRFYSSTYVLFDVGLLLHRTAKSCTMGLLLCVVFFLPYCMLLYRDIAACHIICMWICALAVFTVLAAMCNAAVFIVYDLWGSLFWLLRGSDIYWRLIPFLSALGFTLLYSTYRKRAWPSPPRRWSFLGAFLLFAYLFHMPYILVGAARVDRALGVLLPYDCQFSVAHVPTPGTKTQSVRIRASITGDPGTGVGFTLHRIPSQVEAKETSHRFDDLQIDQLGYILREQPGEFYVPDRHTPPVASPPSGYSHLWGSRNGMLLAYRSERGGFEIWVDVGRVGSGRYVISFNPADDSMKGPSRIGFDVLAPSVTTTKPASTSD